MLPHLNVLDNIAFGLRDEERTILGTMASFQDLRVERAVHRLRTSRASVDAIATEVGYADGVTLRTLLRRKLGKGVRELRGRN